MRASASSERTKPAYDSYEAFNDYLEMVMQFAYVSLWSHCEFSCRREPICSLCPLCLTPRAVVPPVFPLAPLLAVLVAGQ